MDKEIKKYRRYGFILYIILQVIRKTLKIKIIKNDKIDEVNESYIFAFWHNKLVASTLCLDYIEKRAVLASPSKDGELISVPLEKLGFHMVRGSSDKNSTSSLISLIKLMKKGYSIGTPVDGPKGPIYEVKQGMVYLAQKGKKYIIPTGTAYKSKWEFKKAWDKFQFPKPFTTMVYLMGEPIEVPADANIEEYCLKIKEELNRLDKEAEKYI
ncbi:MULTISPECIES: lysophospholipid acyltransferase family protein [unclassified Fusobacterium]|uniref:lysophospholipid acyltransferase family protein n=1 Tax=unclassified Fusobacterium TaxID=2648384 RepID=UPI0025BECF0B|nr:lysophospholipid acyltransferase family protein [Fusobacterium sp.]